MRVLLAGLMFFTGIIFTIAVSEWGPPWLRVPLMAAMAILLFVALLRMFNGPDDLLGERSDRRSRNEKSERRMLHTRFPELEEQLGFELPDALKRGYTDPGLVLREFFHVVGSNGETWDIEGFEPAHPGKWIDARIAKVDGFVFARNLDAEVYYLPPPAGHAPSPVLLRKFSGEDLLVASSFDEFLTFPTQDIPEEDEEHE